MSTDTPSKAPPRCNHCGRVVRETLHTRSSYRVDYYGLHTGDVEPVKLSRGDDLPPLTVLKLLSASEVVTCADCYREPRVRAQRERLFRPEILPAPAAEGRRERPFDQGSLPAASVDGRRHSQDILPEEMGPSSSSNEPFVEDSAPCQGGGQGRVRNGA
jgi:hypothetical protein